ncbi:zf-HC2 domain-containing protein [Microbacterium thalli]|uniref:Zf-HC2 domain-containing protein n=1 Tax=Microbacterium thalli TaxID=3027921 RepID=A0ABT5SH96_9MICO|nr:zf-HC2 domain-containing protein [Microbacterium thalli]MDD7930413.1 zf-HC2 domain-containing protein [Microbacterium thalli]MDD7962204.1 zf-HC2 domain-containing protein [Microbacterium thalli]MDN8549693.1 zf-HC2 domain-containing protein [Microbacterium thalli]
MSDCGCDKARRDLEEYLRDEVCKTEHAEIREHLESCPACRDEALVSRTLTEVVARACRETAPEELRDQVLARLRAAQSAAHA